MTINFIQPGYLCGTSEHTEHHTTIDQTKINGLSMRLKRKLKKKPKEILKGKREQYPKIIKHINCLNGIAVSKSLSNN